MGKVVDTLISYITHFCFPPKGDPISGNRRETGLLLRQRDCSEIIRLLVSLESCLSTSSSRRCCKPLKSSRRWSLQQMQMTRRKGSDGVHIRWTNGGELLEVIFAEAKLYKDCAAALTSAFVSMTDFHNSATKELEINYFLNTFSLLSAEQQAIIASYVDGENKKKCQQVHVCLIGYNWDEYECLESPEKKEHFSKSSTVGIESGLWQR